VCVWTMTPAYLELKLKVIGQVVTDGHSSMFLLSRHQCSGIKGSMYKVMKMFVEVA